MRQARPAPSQPPASPPCRHPKNRCLAKQSVPKKKGDTLVPKMRVRDGAGHPKSTENDPLEDHSRSSPAARRAPNGAPERPSEAPKTIPRQTIPAARRPRNHAPERPSDDDTAANPSHRLESQLPRPKNRALCFEEITNKGTTLRSEMVVADGAAHPTTTEKRPPGRPFPQLGELQTALGNAHVDPFRDPTASRFPGDAKVAVDASAGACLSHAHP